MRYEIIGDVMQRLDVHLRKHESIYTEAGGMSWMSDGIEMSTHTHGGIVKGLSRTFAGESLFMTTYTCRSENGLVALTTDLPGKILAFELGASHSLICQKGAFLCAQPSVQLGIHIRHKIGAGLFGGEGFVLQKVTGPGWFFAEIVGEAAKYELGDGEIMKVNPGYLALHEPSVECDVAFVKGVRNLIFGREGIFLATLRGPGKIWLQTMPVANMAARLLPFILPQQDEG